MKFPEPTITYAPPRFPCTDCRISHGGCAINYTAGNSVCCDTCNHQPTTTEGN